MEQATMTKDNLIDLGYGMYQSKEIIRKAKTIMINKGYPYYNNKRLGRVPVHAIEEILGCSFDNQKEVMS